MKQVSKYAKDGSKNLVTEEWSESELRDKNQHELAVNKVWAMSLLMMVIVICATIVVG